MQALKRALNPVLQLSWPPRWLLIVNFLVVGLLLIYLLLANIATLSSEQNIKTAWTEFIKPFPQQSSASALKLDSLAAKLGFENLLTGPDTNGAVSSPTKSDIDTQEAIREVLSNYLPAQSNRVSDELDPLPDTLKDYLAQKNTQILELRDYILSSEEFVWNEEYLDPNKIPDFTTVLPSFLNLLNLQRLFISSAINQENMGQSEEAEKTLAASFRLSQTIAKNPSLIAQLVAIIGINQHGGIIRKFDALTVEWLEKLEVPDLYTNMKAALELEAFSAEETLRNYLRLKLDMLDLIEEMNGEEVSRATPFLRLQRLFHQPYLSLSAVNYFQSMQRGIKRLQKIDFCGFDAENFLAQVQTEPGWWNYLRKSFPNFFNQFQKVTKMLVHWELTGKILQIKQLARQMGTLPKEISGIEASRVCPDIHWDYEVTADGEALIGLNNPPVWFKIPENDLPLNYRLRMEDISR